MSRFDSSDLEIVTLNELRENSSGELLALIKARAGMDAARAERALATIRFADRLTWRELRRVGPGRYEVVA